MSQNTTTTSPLLALPPDLRLIIYEFTLTDLQRRLQRRKTKPTSFRLPLLNTCRLIRKEALPLYEKELDRILTDSRRLVARLKEKSHMLDFWWFQAWELDLVVECRAIEVKERLVQRRRMVVEYEFSRLKRAVGRERRRVKDACLEMEGGGRSSGDEDEGGEV
ncbi:uncharacterized protein MYCFIDRAFT_78441 [Pseudocercospora fijiensis CIRAD86]|uniref:F-box domain-containing protein n=1 Tax=Pseudocercospora fijiensis (strain CIRAD86) TaxID=383855 RepID=N1QC10_PSEFD|nr:uncharacterized protein MYCFIDRAFT_78441 [Pseudocercospora fijiensis CIRAD86]EME89781.1 hypothetical protein MYCFIDRAFT_78441 [Pseudocercospora fijiensis CIRAD86]